MNYGDQIPDLQFVDLTTDDEVESETNFPAPSPVLVDPPKYSFDIKESHIDFKLLSIETQRNEIDKKRAELKEQINLFQKEFDALTMDEDIVPFLGPLMNRLSVTISEVKRDYFLLKFFKRNMHYDPQKYQQRLVQQYELFKDIYDQLNSFTRVSQYSTQ